MGAFSNSVARGRSPVHLHAATRLGSRETTEGMKNEVDGIYGCSAIYGRVLRSHISRLRKDGSDARCLSSFFIASLSPPS